MPTTSDGPTPGRVSLSRDPSAHRIRMRSEPHWLGKAGYCSICNRNERLRKGRRIGVTVRAAQSETAHWICPECARQIAKVAPW